MSAVWRPYIETYIAAFGAERTMFGPVTNGGCGYLALWNAFKRIAAIYSAAEKAALFVDSSARCPPPRDIISFPGPAL
jgi:L-fuconolactonase